MIDEKEDRFRMVRKPRGPGRPKGSKNQPKEDEPTPGAKPKASRSDQIKDMFKNAEVRRLEHRLSKLKDL